VTKQATVPLVLLGSGYTGLVLHRMGTLQGRTVHATSRSPLTNLATIPSEQRLKFDLEQPSTWPNIPVGADLIWCFPATPLAKVEAFAKTLGAMPRRLVVLGSTSAYDVGHSQEYPPPWIDETAPIDLSKPRVEGEELLRASCGAIVLRVAGIYGPGRNPLDWIKSGRVSPSRRYVNLIHVEDLAAICLLALEKGKPGQVYNVSDGTPRTWEQICRFAQQHNGVATPTATINSETGKRISNRKLMEELDVSILHLDLFSQLDST
jgi:hypothetical protein